MGVPLPEGVADSLRADCQIAAGVVVQRLLLEGESSRDLAQECYFRILKLLPTISESDATLGDEARRRGLAFRVAKLIGYETLRRRDTALRHRMHATRPDEVESPAKNAERIEQIDALLRLASQIPPDGPARLAYNIAEKRTTLPDYAAENRVSLRTAQRHYLEGVKQLRRWYEQRPHPDADNTSDSMSRER
ncbi:MAG: hypothetical protein IT435_11525 [Phycisphaerales bacterium]|nr:hypothetical protein [Phycisphaerales bacterium]